MARIHARLLLLFVPLLAALAGPALAAERELLTLESAPPGIVLEVLEKSDAQLPNAPALAQTWRLKAGDTVTGSARPGDRVIELYTGTLHAPTLLCRVIVRYYRAASGWIPQFRLDEEPLVARVNGRWRPLDPARGLAGLVQIGSTLPNGDGFFPTIEFGLGGAMLPIVAWQVR